jgi:hypothetical protein
MTGDWPILKKPGSKNNQTVGHGNYLVHEDGTGIGQGTTAEGAPVIWDLEPDECDSLVGVLESARYSGKPSRLLSSVVRTILARD